MEAKIEMGKKYVTKNGYPVRVLCVDADVPEHPVLVLVAYKNGEVARFYSDTGHNVSYPPLVEVTPYDDYKVDEPVVAVTKDGTVFRAHFAGVCKEGHPMVFAYGRSKWASGGDVRCVKSIDKAGVM